MPDAPNHKSPKKNFELKYEKKKKKCNKASDKPMDSQKNNERQAQQITKVAKTRILKKTPIYAANH